MFYPTIHSFIDHSTSYSNLPETSSLQSIPKKPSDQDSNYSPSFLQIGRKREKKPKKFEKKAPSVINALPVKINPWTPQEDQCIARGIRLYGKKWRKISIK